MGKQVEFVSYDGKWPNLCSGVLTLKINGKEEKFGFSFKGEQMHPKFWSSGGSCGFFNNYSDSYVNQAPWEFTQNDLPEQFQEYFEEISEVFNENVPFGCCGGCL